MRDAHKTRTALGDCRKKSRYGGCASPFDGEAKSGLSAFNNDKQVHRDKGPNCDAEGSRLAKGSCQAEQRCWCHVESYDCFVPAVLQHQVRVVGEDVCMSKNEIAYRNKLSL